MGGCASKPPRSNPYSDLPEQPNTPEHDHHRESSATGKSSPFYSLSPVQSLLGILKSPARPPSGGGNTTPKKPEFPPPSPAKHIMAVLMRRRRRKDDDDSEVVAGLDKRFGLKKRFKDEYEVGDEVGRGHFGYTVSATCKSGDHAGEKVAVKVIPKDKVSFINYY
ncbi:putative non-specific serine/threonine protein kinase [Helianthus annuus]|nr:putative non-specific serine/threonine protein kinase [Helianthus annuus]